MKARRHDGQEANAVHSADRVLAGHCPRCGRVLIILNNHEVWPYVQCTCDWAGATTDFDHTRLVRRTDPNEGDR